MKTTGFLRLVRAVGLYSSLLAASVSWAASFTLNPTLDAFVTPGATGSLVNSNYGGAGALGVSAVGSPQGEFQTLLQFNLAGAKSSFDTTYGVGQWSIQSVTLQFTATSPNNPIFNSSAAGQYSILWQQNDTWPEGTGNPMIPTNNGVMFSTFSNYVSGADEMLGTFSFGGGTSGNVTNGLSLTALFSADMYNGTNVSFRLFAADGTISALFDSRSFSTTAFRPVLTVNAIPEPALPALVALGLSLFQWRRWKHRNRV